VALVAISGASALSFGYGAAGIVYAIGKLVGVVVGVAATTCRRRRRESAVACHITADNTY
jgi:hypothetical protein